MEKQTLTKLFSGKTFRIPDYQRGYAWGEKQCQDLIEDIDSLVTDERVKVHYTGTIVTYSPLLPPQTYDRKEVEVMDVVDGQQRLTSICLYLSIIINTLINNQEKEYERDIADFLFHERTCRLTLNNSTEDLFYHLLKNGTPRNEVTTPHQKRLLYAFEKFTEHIQKQLNDKDLGIEYLKKVFTAITGKLVFTYYAIEEECELGMTFELMNSRGKKLSVLELLKNYLMYWISRNGGDEEKDFLTQTVNTAWSDTYNNIGKSTGNDEQCLRIAWTLYCHHLPKHWNRYDGFKDNKYLPLRDFSIKTREDVKDFLITFTDGLAHISKHYGAVITPSQSNTLCNSELEWLTKIHHTGNIANFLPLMVAARIQQEKGECIKDKYLNLLAALECYAVRVFLFEGKRSNAGKSSFFRWSKELFENKTSIESITNSIHSLIRYYSPEDKFIKQIETPSNWYSRRRSLKYTLYEYEKHLLDSECRGQQPRISWAEIIKDSTLEHILPQTPKGNSHWLTVWQPDEIKYYLHDIGNLVLTRDNANYLNFDFTRKKGKIGSGICYCNSHIKQERDIAAYEDWTKETLLDRRTKLVDWIITRWKTMEVLPALDINETADDD